MEGAAVRKPRVPNDELHRVTDNRLAEADRKVLRGMCRWSLQAGKIWEIAGIKSFNGEVSYGIVEYNVSLDTV